MINRHEITSEQALNAIENGEFGRDVLSGEYVIIVMTQDWCPQWVSMNRWIYGLETDKNIEIYELVYNKTDYSSAFMEFKEKTLGNSLIPYLRIYKYAKAAGNIESALTNS